MNNALFASSFAPPTPNTAIPPQTLCPSNVPLVLLPVRLETRFFTLAGNVTELQVRIYPDKIHVDTHQPELTTDERTWGTQYWQQDWLVGNDTAARADAWRTLASRFGAARAAWIARVLQPTNIQQRPTTPVPSGTPPAFPPVFPTLPPVGVNGESAWRHAPQARLLPDRWVAVVHSAGQVVLSVTGKDIVRPLAVGPDPNAAPPDAATEAAILAGDQLALDPDMMWLVDFNAAEDKGMALRITVPPATLAAGIDSLVVFGVATSLGVANTATQLADLLDAHHYTDGLEFLRWGTPTNNTDDRRAAYNSEDPGHMRSFGNEVLADPWNAPNAARVGTALGLPAARIAPTLGHIGQATEDHDLDLRSMNTALWPVGWGYYLSNMIGAETGLTPASIDWARAHFLNYVRSGGPFPALRCGPQPYGILPVTSLDLWAPGANEAVTPQETWLQTLLRNLRDNVWRPVVNNVARIGLRTTDPDADLNDVMRTDGVSYGSLTRSVLGRHYVEHLYSFNALDFSGLAQTQDAVAAKLLQLSGLSTLPGQRPHAAHGFLLDFPMALAVPLVQPGEVSPWQSLSPNYIGVLLATPTIQGLIDARPSPTARDHTTSLLQTLLRHSLLREIATVTARIASTLPGNDLATLLRDLELVDLVDVPPVNHTLQTPPKNLHWRRQLDLTAPGLPAGMTIRQYLEGLTSFTAPAVPAVASLGELRASLTHLQTQDSESLQLLMQGTLDLSAHRLDAWITSFATKRLALMAPNGPIGQYVGAYGWVENLRPVATPPTPLPAASVPPYPLIKDSGFIHAPSLAHASTAALLRNAHLGPAQTDPTGAPLPNGPFAIDLSSGRVREASRLLEGVRQGQPLSALLGYRLERRLHDLNLDIFIAPLRRIAPLVVRQREEATKAPAEALGADNVVDALALLRFRQTPDDPTVPQAIASVTATTLQQNQAVGEIDALFDVVDGLSDALTAEAAYQMVRGNTARLASTLSAIAQGDGLPPELEVARMPRTGNSITHRVVVLFSGVSNAGGGWTASTTRSVLERWLGTWIRALLGDARKVRCTVERLDDVTGAVVQTVTFPLNDVSPLSPLDFVYYTQPAGQSPDASAAPTIAEQLVLYHARRMTNGFAVDANLRLQHARPTDLAAGETTLFDVLEVARAIRRLLEGARELRPEDLSSPDRPGAATINLADLETRVVHYEASFNAVYQTLVSITTHTTIDAETIRTALLNIGAFAVGPSVPNIAVGDSPEIRAALTQQVAAAAKIAKARLDKDTALRAQPVATDQRARCAQLVERARAIYGDEFVCLPYFTFDAAPAAELNSALAASTAQQGGDSLAVHGWFTRSSRVRDSLARLGACMQGAEVLASGTRLSLSVAQLPFDATERWVGLPPLPTTELPPSKLSLVVQPLTALNATLPLCGLFIDEWVEVVPNQKETTALTFQFDPPNSFAPQNVLIAVPPVPGQDWTTETLRCVLMETLDLAKLRAVDTSLLGAAAQYLPALYVPFNAADDAVSTDFAPLTVIAKPAGASMGGLTVAIADPTMNATVGRSAQVTGSVNAAPGVAPGVVTGVQIQFGAGGPTAQATLAAPSWSWQGLIPTSIRPGQSFQIIASASVSGASAGPPPTPVPLNQDVVNVVLENVVPVLTVDPFPSAVTVTQVPYVTTLSGSISEGSGAPYTTPLVQYRVGTGPLANLTVAQGQWSVPLSLQAGDNLITVQASDAFGSVTAFQKTLTVVLQNG
jgi:hypothetical protein